MGLLASFMGSPLQTHWHAGLRILRYVKSTLGLGILYSADHDISQAVSLFGWTNFDWAGDVDSRRSTTGYCFTLGLGAISRSSKKKPTVALSSIEAAYRVACSGTCKAVWLRRLLGDLGFSQQTSSLVFCDNQSCLAIAHNPIFHACTKHIEVQYHFVCEKLLDGTIALEYCSTEDNLADLFTKALSHSVVVSHSRSLGLVSCPWI